jgi:hypothetical protein
MHGVEPGRAGSQIVRRAAGRCLDQRIGRRLEIEEGIEGGSITGSAKQ